MPLCEPTFLTLCTNDWRRKIGNGLNMSNITFGTPSCSTSESLFVEEEEFVCSVWFESGGYGVFVVIISKWQCQ